MKCPKCSSSNIKSEGNRSLYSKSITFDFFECNDCGMQFAENPDNQHEEERSSLPTKEEVLEKIREKHKKEDARQEKIDNLLSGSPLPPPPLFTALNNLKDTPDNKGAVELLEKFPFLGNRLLELVNGPCFLSQDTYETFQDLLEKWPLKSVSHLLLALEVADLAEAPQALPVTKNAFWTHGIVSGLAAKSMAQFLGESDLPKYFLTGFLLNIGRWVIASNLPDAALRALKLSKNSGESLFESEEKILEFNHAQVGGNLLEQWGLEDKFSKGVVHHFRPQFIKNPPQEVYIFHVSEAIAHDLKLGSSGEKQFPRPDSFAVQALGLTRSFIDNIKGEALSLIGEAKRLIIV